MILELSLQIFEKSSKIEFHENPIGGGLDASCGRTDTQSDGRTVIVSFRNSANGPKI